MKDSDTILSNQLPYEQLAKLGLDREKVEKLPQEVKEKLIKGEVTPLMEVSLPATNGMVITLPLKLQLAADKEGNPTLIAYPVQRELSTERSNELKLTQQEMDALRRGDVLQKTVDIDGEKTRRYLQLDPETKSIIHRRVTEVQIEQRLKDMEKVNDIELGTQQKQQVREGETYGTQCRWRESHSRHRPQGTAGIQGRAGRHEGMGATAEAPLRRPPSRISRSGNDRQKPLGVSEGGRA